MKKSRGTTNPAPTVTGGKKREDVWLDRFAEKLAKPNNAERQFYEERQKKGQGVGLDGAGKLVYPKKSDKK